MTHRDDDRGVGAQLDLYRRRYFGPLCLLLLTLQIVAGLVWHAIILPSVLDLTFPEGAVVARSVDVAAGRSPYQDWRRWPHAFSPYGPLTYATVGWVARAIGAEASARTHFIVGRAQSLLCLAGIWILIALLLRAWGGSARWSLLALGCFFYWEPLTRFVASFRPDAPQAFFSLLALWLAASGRADARRIAAALICLQISFWFKPMSWGMPLALGLWIWRDAGWKRAAGSIGAFALVGLAGAFILNAATNGNFFLNMIGSLDNGWKPTNLISFYRRLFFIPGAVLLLGLGFSIARLAAGRQGEPGWLVSWALVASYAAASAQNLKVGADVNYYLEVYALASVATAMGISDLWNGRFRLSRARREAVFYLVLIPGFVFDMVFSLASVRPQFRGATQAWKEIPLIERARNADGLVLATNPMLALAGTSSPTIMDHVQYGILRERGKLEDNDLIDRIERREFALIILPVNENDPEASEPPLVPEFYSPRFPAALAANYRRVERIGIFSLFEPIEE